MKNEQIKPVKTVKMTPASQTQGVRVDVDVVYLDDIPKAMDKMGWKVAAQLMRRWFATKPAWAMPEKWRSGADIDYLSLPESQVEDKIIKMQWLLGFERVIPVFEDLCQTWNSPRGIKELTTKLEEKFGWTQGKSVRVGHGLRTAKELDKVCQVNAKPVGGMLDTMDDLYGAIGNGTLKLAVVGKTSRSLYSKHDIFEIEKVGVYLRDTYDFNSDDMIKDVGIGLGIWSKDRVLSKAEMIEYKLTPLAMLGGKFPGFVPARNNDFRRWQAKRNEGGDFFVFSDVMWIEPHVEYVILPSS